MEAARRRARGLPSLVRTPNARGCRPLDEGLRIEAECFNRLLATPEIGEGLRRFNERDHPDRAAGGGAQTPGLSRSRP
jgi:hypothetical protein